jgi:hypothetical protein
MTEFLSVTLTGMLPTTEHSLLTAVDPALLDSKLHTKGAYSDLLHRESQSEA